MYWGRKKNILRLTEEKRNGKIIKWKAGGKLEEEIRIGQKRRGKKKCKRGGKEGKKKKRVIGKKWTLPGTEPIPGLKDREGKKKKKMRKKKKKKMRKKKVALHRIEPGPLTLMDIGRYA